MSVINYLCVGATKGAFCKDIKMIINRDYIKPFITDIVYFLFN